MTPEDSIARDLESAIEKETESLGGDRSSRLFGTTKPAPAMPRATQIEPATATTEKPFVVMELLKKAKLFEERNGVYGDNYKRHGKIMALLMGNQKVDMSDPDTQNRLGLLTQKVAKLTRYCENFDRGGHDDSLDDDAVYSMMLKEVDTEARNRKKAF